MKNKEMKKKSTNCDCGSKWKHKKYQERDAQSKESGFNNLLWRAKRKFTVYLVMDSVGLNSTRKLIQLGVEPFLIRAFTWCKYDYEKMLPLGKTLGINSVSLEDATTMYKKTYYENMVIIHDGMQTWRNTKDDIELLFKKKYRYLEFIINISLRCHYSSHQFVKADITKMSSKYNYAMSRIKDIKCYKQIGGQNMQPYRFALKIRS